MTVRVAAAAALGALLLAGCSSPAPAAPTPSPTMSDSTVKSTCDAMASGTTITDFAARLVPDPYPDLDTAKYEVRKRVTAGCPQYLSRP